MVVRPLLQTCCCSFWSHIYCWSLLIWCFVLLRFHIGKLWGKNRSSKRRPQKNSLIGHSVVLGLQSIHSHLVMIIRLFRVILKLNHYCDMPVMLPDPVAQQFKPQTEFSVSFSTVQESSLISSKPWEWIFITWPDHSHFGLSNILSKRLDAKISLEGCPILLIELKNL